MVVLEALAHGLPVVVSQAQYCGIAELLVHETDALIVDNPRDPAALAEALGRMLTDTALAQRLGDNGQRFATQHLWSAQAALQERIYFVVAGAQPG
jgi:UDP-glucose:(heptosyl)LPS alpha-1,3-glucosyltransferase